jgi:hypothetical protein
MSSGRRTLLASKNPATWLGFLVSLDLFGLEDDAGSELDLAGLTVGSYGSDVAEVAGGRARDVGGGEDRMIERVEGFKAQLHEGCLGEVEVLQE